MSYLNFISTSSTEKFYANIQSKLFSRNFNEIVFHLVNHKNYIIEWWISIYNFIFTYMLWKEVKFQ